MDEIMLIKERKQLKKVFFFAIVSSYTYSLIVL